MDTQKPSRNPVGFLATLTPEQRVKAFAYKGPETFGDPKYRRKTTTPGSMQAEADPGDAGKVS